MTDKPTQTDAELQSIIDDADAGPPTDNEWLCLECGRWTPWRHEEAHDHADGCKAPAIYAAKRDWKTRLKDYMAKGGIPAGRATAAPAQPAAQLGVAYAEMPTHSHTGRVYEEGFLIGTCPLYTADQMRAFADATHALRVSHGQAPAQAAPAAVAWPDDYTPLLDDEGRMMVGTSHHYTAENIRALVAEYKALEAGEPDTWELHYNTDHRARAGVLWRVISALADEVPFAAALATQPAPQQEAQEPAGWFDDDRVFWHEGKQPAQGSDLYTAPQPSPTAQADSQPAPDERDDFEKVFPLPSGCIRVGTGYASTGYSNWAAHTHCERWQGWRARAAQEDK